MIPCLLLGMVGQYHSGSCHYSSSEKYFCKLYNFSSFRGKVDNEKMGMEEKRIHTHTHICVCVCKTQLEARELEIIFF